ncbi:MAG: hypothetical protein ACR2LE_01530 [Nocardioidaceae bacterium]
MPRPSAGTPRVPFVVLLVGLLAGGLIGLLILNTTMQRGAYAASDLRARSAALGVRQQNLQMQVAALQQPQRVAQAALRLGMVRNDNPAFLSLVTGKIVGSPQAGDVSDRPVVKLPAGIGATTRGKHPVLVGGELESLHGLFVVPEPRESRRDVKQHQHSDQRGAQR